MTTPQANEDKARKELTTSPVVKEVDPLHTFKSNDFGSREGEVPAYLRGEGKAGPFDEILGVDQMLPGERGWASLDDAGNITGVYPFPPDVDSGVKACAVRKAVPTTDLHHSLLSEAGADLQPPLIPNPDIRFAPSSSVLYKESDEAWSKQNEKRHVRNTKGTDFGESPQLTGAYEDRATHSQNRGVVAGVEGEKQPHAQHKDDPNLKQHASGTYSENKPAAQAASHTASQPHAVQPKSDEQLQKEAKDAAAKKAAETKK